MMPKVLNKRTDEIPSGAIYVGRPSKWGNPYRINKLRTREQAITMYREGILCDARLMAALHELRGHDLVCRCSPLPCHADVLLELANEEVR